MSWSRCCSTSSTGPATKSPDPQQLGTFKIFLLDEAWLFLKNETIRSYIVQAQKTWRKHHAAMILATQSIKELEESGMLQIVPTPPELADRMVALADVRPGQLVLEPSAGTGRIIDAIRRNAHGYAITAVELNCNMAHRLRTVDGVDDTRQADFLECNGDLGTFDRIVMNPPFANADDIKHIMHALKMLKPGGRLVAICANGPKAERQA